MQKTTRILLSTFTLLALILGGFASPTSTVSAAGAITVNTDADNLTDDNLCTLREAITNANADAQTYDDCAIGSGADTITFVGDYIITLGSALPQVTTEMTIDGTSQSVTVSGNDTYRVFNVSAAGNLTINVLMIANGSALGGGIYNEGTLMVTNSALSGNSGSQGGGIANYGTATVNNSTFSDNISNGGGGIYNSGTLTVTNSTFSGNNTFESVGGGIYNNSGTLMVTNSTFSGNYADVAGGGIYNMSGTVYLAGTIFAGSTGGNCFNNGGTFIDNGYNLSDDSTCTNGGTGSATNATLNLDVLADNGGPTWTHALLSGSDVIDAILNGTTISNNGITWTCNNADPFTDQRGVARPQGTGCDSGAFEQTQSLVVTKAADTDDGVCDTDCSLREAIKVIGDGGTITFAGDYTITLGSALPDITTEMTIDGTGQSVSVSGNNAHRIFNVTSSGNLTVNQATLQNGLADYGGGIRNQGTLLVTNSTFSGHQIADGGGGIYNNNGTVTVSSSTFSGNDGNGGGIYNSSGTVTVDNSTFSGNFGPFGGGIYNDQGTLTVTNSAFSGNSANNFGGGIYNQGTLNVTNSTFHSNSATLLGGGLFNAASGTTLTNVTFSDNSAFVGGGLTTESSNVTLINATFSNNSATSSGGAMALDNASATITNVIITNSTNGNNCSFNNGGSIAGSSSYNLIDDTSCGLTDGINNNMIGASYDAMLGSLADNGGPTNTHALLAGSDAIDAGDNTACADAGTVNNLDQRGVARPQGSACDIGAYEFAPTFTDVPISHWAWQYVETLYNSGITGGCGAGNYCPDNQVTRAQMAVFLLRGIHGSSYTPPAATGTVFNDVGAGAFAAAWIEQMVSEGITSGCGGGNYCPNATVTRAQMAVFLLRAKYGSGYTPPAATGTVFTDVTLGSFGAAWIEQLVSEGVTSGCGGGNYCPNQAVTRAQMAVFLVRIFNLP